MITEAPLSLHESLIPPDEDDQVIVELRAAMTAGREAAEGATKATATILKNKLATDVANHRAARATNWKFWERASTKMDAARDRAKRVIQKIETETSTPPQPTTVAAT